MSKRIKFKSTFLFLFSLLAAANILLLRQNEQIRGMIFEDYSQLDLLKTGDRVSPFTADLLGGGRIEIGNEKAGKRRVLLFFSPACRFSHEQFPYWSRLIDESEARGLQVIGLVPESDSRGAVDEFLRSQRGEGLQVAVLPKGVQESYKLMITPMTVIVDDRSRVEKIWVGRWDYQTLIEVNRTLTPSE